FTMKQLEGHTVKQRCTVVRVCVSVCLSAFIRACVRACVCVCVCVCIYTCMCVCVCVCVLVLPDAVSAAGPGGWVGVCVCVSYPMQSLLLVRVCARCGGGLF